MIGGPFTLVDHHNRSVTEASFFGRHALVFFGFTHCKVVCPRALTRISAALDQLGEAADRFHPLYITVDPERDTPTVMRSFLERYPRFLGLTGERAAIDALRKSYRVFAQRRDDPDAPDGYIVPHSALTYLLGPDGAYVAHFPDTYSAAELTDRLLDVVQLR